MVSRWQTGMACVVDCLAQLKRSNWSWAWPIGAPESFDLPAVSFLGKHGRAGVGSAFVGVMQSTGRPFGDLELALLSCERLAAASQDEREAARNRRDEGVLLCHLHRYDEAKAALEEYWAWLEGHPEAGVPSEEGETVAALLFKLKQLTLEKVYSAS
jgi:hypothetical protein